MEFATVVEMRRDRSGTIRVSLDEGTAFSINHAVAAEAGLRPGTAISLEEIERLKSSDVAYRSLNSALCYLGPRPRSEREIRARLGRRGYDAETIRWTLDKLKEQGLVDDAAFAQFWRQNRDDFRPMSRRMIGLELKQKGVDAETSAETGPPAGGTRPPDIRQTPGSLPQAARF
jgi:regulatory protein